MAHKLFSYGTLQYPQVQINTFGRLLDTQAAEICGYRLEQVEITDPAVLAASGQQFHPILVATNNERDQVKGVVVDLTDNELVQADAYEVDDYRRIEVTLRHGQKAWCYVAVEHTELPALKAFE
ncbi:gamma-glutamylcyclotransferase family protein [Aliiglaciecola sp. LCG003]|uniref:gamma-glutamylcyclotransferase family protein n=1 Tax=Aliiglaciecola sp. LCG003 TaxID=3053655 RepID=UPI0025747462|nr:gamma-glutamylcyclotransferase family protein [Aliiglaciecola sp. LCG003]WJG10392.1 gamma-glutamylcyclotransferase family protein [Aliiglaciecola sp. LCG003]